MSKERRKQPRAILFMVTLAAIQRNPLIKEIYIKNLQKGKSKMDAIIEFSELGDFIDQPIATYSSGMVARLGFSVAFQVDPDILLIDEVLGVGDAEFSQKSAKVMQDKIHSNKTIVFVSHNAVLIQQLCNRVVWIEEGISRVEGEPESVLKEYHQFLHLA